MYHIITKGPLEEDKNMFIAAQGPLPNSKEKFWKLIVNKKIKLIIMLTQLNENGRAKCDQYWPKSQNDPIVFENIKITLDAEEEILKDAVIQRNFSIFVGDAVLNITQLQIICWNDHSVPEDQWGYKSIELVSTFIDDSRKTDKESPILIHCRYDIFY